MARARGPTTAELSPALNVGENSPRSDQEQGVSPYLLQKRTPPPRASSPEAPRPRQRPRRSPEATPPTRIASRLAPPLRQRGRTTSHSTEQPGTESLSTPDRSGSTPSPTQAKRLQLLVQPIVKNCVTQHEVSAEALEDIVANGSSFQEIMQKLWQQFSSRVKGLAVKQNGTWALGEAPPSTAWTTGVDRSGVTAESSLRDVAAQLQDIWGATFQAHGTVWRMWANEITRNLDRSTWETAVLDNPPNHVLRLLKPAETQVDQQLSGLTQSAQLALDCVNASIAENEQLKRDCDALRLRLDSQSTSLTSRKLIIEAFLADIPPLSVNEVVDPFNHMENIDDEEHQQ